MSTPQAGLLGARVDRVHMVGIAGAGMEGLARVLVGLGYRVSGSDLVHTPVLEDLRRSGVGVAVGHEAERVRGADLVVYSAAVPGDNCERAAARRLGIPERSRAAILGALSQRCDTVAVAGTHGKTTTASLIAAAASQAGRAPTVAVGGWVGGRSQATAGGGTLLVAEADEYARSFLELEPWLAVVTNVEPEHVDWYRDEDAVVDAFAAFLGKVRADGQSVVNGDDERSLRAARAAGVRPVTFGFGEGCQVRAGSLSTTRGGGSQFEVSIGGLSRGRLDLRLPGRHNVGNALAAVAACCQMELEWEAVRQCLRDFPGVDRRFQVKGEWGGVRVVDDYAHHPTELAAALEAARPQERPLTAVFQPHTYSRTRHFRRDFAAALAAARTVYVTAVYAARETSEAGVDGDAIVEDLRDLGHRDAHFVADAGTALGLALAGCRCGDLLLVMGAGDIGAQLDAALRPLPR